MKYMNDLTRSLLVIFGIIVIFGLSYIAYDHIDNSYILNKPTEIKELKAENDSLETVVKDLRKERNSLQDKVKKLEEKSGDK